MAADRLPESMESFSDYDKPPSVKKRKYRKHPKPDPNAPKKPSPSAYHLFALEQGNRLRKEGYCFEDIARETGAMWRALPPQTVNELESKTTQAKNQYRKDVSSYKKSTNYREYQEYLKRWMAKEEAKKKRAEASVQSLSNGQASMPPRKSSPAVTTNPLSPISTVSTSTSTADDLPALDLPTSNSPHSSTSSFPPSSTNSINANSTLQPMNSLFTSSRDDQDAQAEPEEDWFLSNSLGGPMSIHMQAPIPELSIREQLEWKWSADFDATLAPDPLFPLMPSRSSQQSSYANNGKGNNDPMIPDFTDGSLSTSSPWLSSSSFSTVSPSMLTNVGTVNPFSSASYPFTFGSDSTGFRRRGGYGIDNAAC